MDKKYIFIDLDGTMIDHSSDSVRESTRLLLKELREKGHELFICTGRPLSLFYGIEKELGFDSYVAANGSYAVYKNQVILNEPIDPETVKKVVDFFFEKQIDIGFESQDDYVVNSRFTDYMDGFSDLYHLHHPEVRHNYHLDHDIHQMVLYYIKDDFKQFEDHFDGLTFNYSNEYGIDINQIGGLKDLGIKAIQNHLGIDTKDIIAVGDGFNDISMIEYAGLGISMGNAKKPVRDSADVVADDVANDGLYKVFKELKMI